MRVTFPHQVESQYRARLRRRVELMKRACAHALGWLNQRADNLADDRRVTASIAAANRAYDAAVPVDPASLLPIATATDRHATRGVAAEVEHLVTVDVEADKRIGHLTRQEMRALHLQWARENASLIRTMERETFDDVARHVVDTVVNGKTDLSDVLQARFGVSKNRADLIARDQVAKLNSRITEARQTQLGITSYRWSSSGDERVRPLHRELDGTVRRWDDPHPTEGHPGRAIACRCVAIPVVDLDSLLPELPDDFEPPEDEPSGPPSLPRPTVPPPRPLRLPDLDLTGLPSFAPGPGRVPVSVPQFRPQPSPSPFGEPELFEPPAVVEPASLPRPVVSVEPARLPTFEPSGAPAFVPARPGTFPDLRGAFRPRAPSPFGEPALFEPPAPAVQTYTKAETVLFEKTGNAAGSNEGGFYTGRDGVKRYVKFYADPSQAHQENISNAIYRALGLGAPESAVFEADGRIVYSSDIIPGVSQLGRGLTDKQARKVLDGFAADVLTANWDAVGLSFDNVATDAAGNVYRIDNGGTLLFRAKAGKKPVGLLKQITEWDKFLDSSVNPTYSAVAKRAGVSSAAQIKGIKAQIKRIVQLRKDSGGWAAFVEEHAPGMSAADRATVADMLESRTELLRGKLRELEHATRAARKAGPVNADVAELLKRKYDPLSGGAAREYGQELAEARKAAALSFVEQDAIRHYTGSAYRRINTALRADEPPGLVIGNMDAGIAKVRTTRDTMAVRGLGQGNPQLDLLDSGGLPDGSTIIDKGFTSTSIDIGRAFSGRYRLNVRVPKGSIGVYVDDFSQNRGEQEILLPRNAKLRVLSSKKVGGEWVVECLYLSE